MAAGTLLWLPGSTWALPVPACEFTFSEGMTHTAATNTYSADGVYSGMFYNQDSNNAPGTLPTWITNTNQMPAVLVKQGIWGASPTVRCRVSF